MAKTKLMACADCQKEISKNATSCPHCGAKPVRTHPFTKLVAFFGGLWLFGYFIAGISGPNNSAPVNTVSSAKAPTENWTMEVGTSSMDGTKSVDVVTEARNEIIYWLGHNKPALVIRCHEKKTDIVFITGTAATPEVGSYGEYTVRVRFDEGQPVAYKWSGSTNHEALFASGPVALAKKINQAKTLKIEFTPFNANPQIAEFEVEGLKKYLPEVAKTCGWKV